MPNLPDPASIVQRRRRLQRPDIDALDGDLFGRCRALRNFPARCWRRVGAEAVRGRQSVRLQEPDLYARFIGRTVMGATRHRSCELVTRNFPEGIGTIELIAIYEVRGEHIARGWFSSARSGWVPRVTGVASNRATAPPSISAIIRATRCSICSVESFSRRRSTHQRGMRTASAAAVNTDNALLPRRHNSAAARRDASEVAAPALRGTACLTTGCLS